MQGWAQVQLQSPCPAEGFLPKVESTLGPPWEERTTLSNKELTKRFLEVMRRSIVPEEHDMMDSRRGGIKWGWPRFLVEEIRLGALDPTLIRGGTGHEIFSQRPSQKTALTLAAAIYSDFPQALIAEFKPADLNTKDLSILVKPRKERKKAENIFSRAT